MKDSKFKSLNSKESGLFVKGEVRDIIKMKVNKRDNYIFAINNSKLKIFKNENDKLSNYNIIYYNDILFM